MSKNYKSNPAKTVLTITVGFLIIYMISHQRWAINVAAIIGLVGIFSAFLSEKIEWLWMKIGWLMGLIVPKILLSTIFYLILFPLAIVSNFFRSDDPLMLKNKTSSTFRDVQKEFNKANFENPW